MPHVNNEENHILNSGITLSNFQYRSWEKWWGHVPSHPQITPIL